MTTTTSPPDAASPIGPQTPNAIEIEKDDPRPITADLLAHLMLRACRVLEATRADRRSLSCRHPDSFVFCGRCGALTAPVDEAIEILTETFGAAFALQQVLNGQAIAGAQREYRANPASTPVPTNRIARKPRAAEGQHWPVPPQNEPLITLARQLRLDADELDAEADRLCAEIALERSQRSPEPSLPLNVVPFRPNGALTTGWTTSKLLLVLAQEVRAIASRARAEAARLRAQISPAPLPAPHATSASARSERKR